MSRTTKTTIRCLGLAGLMGLALPCSAACVADAGTAAIQPDFEEWVSTGIEALVKMEEGPDRGEWPYEGVYRVRGDSGRPEIPIGYRVGGTSICALAMIQAPGYDQDTDRREAVKRAVGFVTKSIEHPLMSEEDYDGTYDVRAWGYIYAATFLIKLQNSDVVPAGMKDEVQKAAEWYVDALQKVEIPRVGGWNYARPAGRDKVGSPSSFMTGSALQALFEAKAAGYTVDDDVVTRALDFIESARRDNAGEFVYSGSAGGRGGGVPGAMGRMLVCETTLHLAGRADESRIRGAVDAFFLHWDELEKRRRQHGTHVAPYGVAPYYFFWAHYYAAQAIEQLPNPERNVYRKMMRETLEKIREDNGTWNDRVFERSANYGTAMATMSLMMPNLDKPATWDAPESDKSTSDASKP